MLSRRWLLPTVIVWTLSILPVHAADWPMWRYDAGRGNATPHELPGEMHLQWVRQLPAVQTAWPAEQHMLQFDTAPQPVVMGKQMFVPSTVQDSITAYHTETGKELWRFTAEGPVRFAPVAWEGKVYFVSDDGHLYCVNADNGKLVWKVNGGPMSMQLIGNHRLISAWPARGGPVLHEGKIFFTASIWPFMGIFVHAVDPDTGEILWTNSGDGTNYTVHPHGAPSFGTVAPQGHLAASGDHVIVPGGRSPPALYDAHTGKLTHFSFDARIGSHHVAADGEMYFVGGQSYLLANGKKLSSLRPELLDNSLLYSLDKSDLRVEKVKDIIEVIKQDKKGNDYKTNELVLDRKAKVTLVDRAGDAMLKAGQTLVTGGKNKLTAFDLNGIPAKGSLEPIWKASFKGEVHHLLAGDGRLFVVTTDAKIYCFGADQTKPVNYALKYKKLKKKSDDWTSKAQRILQQPGAKEGFCVALGIGSGRLIEELVRQSDLHVIAVDANEKRVEKFRRQMQNAGLYGLRVSVHVSEPARFALPPYLANLVVAEDPETLGLSENKKLLQKIFTSLRPYGGLACLELPEDQHPPFAKLVKGLNDPQATVEQVKEFSVLTRVGPLPDSANWTHQYADAAQTAISKDKLVKAPLGLLWFGGPSHQDILPRHGHGPAPHVAGGRLFIEGPHSLKAMDVYTGRVLWQKELKDFGKYYDTTKHFPGAGEIGSNYVSLPDKVYAVYRNAILELDAATGELTREFKLQVEDGKEAPYWGFIAVWEDLLITTASPVAIEVKAPPKDAKKEDDKKKEDKDAKPDDKKKDAEKEKDACAQPDEKELTVPLPIGPYGAGSKKLVVFNRQTGELLWSREAEFNFRHNTISIGNGKVFCIDNMTEERLKILKRKGITLEGEPTLYALDARTGKEIWSTKDDVFGTFLNYSEEHDILLQGGSKYRDRAIDEVDRGLAAYRGKDGEVLWSDLSLKYGGPCLLWKDKILTNGAGGFSIDLLTGKATGWKYSRMYGCNTAVGSEYLLTFRSGCAGFFDLENDSGTGNLGGFRSGCTNNLIVADGVLSAPDYTRTCTCAYQNQTSLALIHMPDAEFWTFGANPKAGQLGFNFAAPGDRRAPSGTLWQSKNKIVKTEPKQPEEFRLHSSLVEDHELKWVAASGFEGIQRITIDVKKGNSFKVKLFFLEPAEMEEGDRVFDVILQGETVLKDFDVAAAAGKTQATVIREFTAESDGDGIVLELAPRGKLPPIISGVEIIEN